MNQSDQIPNPGFPSTIHTQFGQLNLEVVMVNSAIALTGEGGAPHPIQACTKVTMTGAGKRRNA